MNEQFKSIIVGGIRSMAAAAVGFLLVLAAKYAVILPDGFDETLTGTLSILLMGVYYGVVRSLSSVKGLEWLEWFLIVPTKPVYVPAVDRTQVLAAAKQVETRRKHP